MQPFDVNLVFTTVAYSICSSLLLVVNKVTLSTVNAPALLLAVQCSFAALALYVKEQLRSRSAIQKLPPAELDRFLVVVMSFVVTLFANMQALHHSNVDAVVCARMTAPLVLSVLDYICLGRELPSKRSLFALVGVIVTSSSFLSNSYLDVTALVWIGVWYCGLLFESIYVKFAVTVSELTTIEQSFYQNIMSAGPFLGIAWATGELTYFRHTSFFQVKSGVILLLSCVLGTGMSYLSFSLRSQISATTFSIIGNGCKLLTILVNLCIWDQHATLAGTFSVIGAIISSSVYQQAPLRKTFNVTHKNLHIFGVLRKRNSWIFIVGTLALMLAIHLRSRVLSESSTSARISGVSGNVFDGKKIRSFKNTKGSIRHLSRTRSAFSDTIYDHCRHWAVCTTVFDPSAAVHDVCSRLQGYCLVVVADLKTQEPYNVSGNCTFIYFSVSRQQQLAKSSTFASRVPWNHFGRKNLGYLFAIANGAQRIWDFDDDNMLLSSDKILPRSEDTGESFLTIKDMKQISINPYPLLGAQFFAWPRGFPLDLIRQHRTRPTEAQIVEINSLVGSVGVIQALANEDPDVDAIYRLQRELPFSFNGMSQNNKLLLVPLDSYIPWNAQATLFRDTHAMWSTYLPISVHGRVSDIWRSFIAQRIFRDTCIRTAFMTEASVRQTRKPHSYLADFDAEQDLYRKSGQMLKFLNSWQAKGADFAANLESLYIDLFERDFIGRTDVELIQLWLAELKLINYTFPRLNAC